MTAFETVIMCAVKDLNKLPFVVRSVFDHTNTGRVHIIAPDASLVPCLGNMSGCVSIYNENEVLDINPKALFRYRPSWIYQQFVKLFQDVTSTDWFLVVDADLLFNRHVSLFEDNKPIFLLGHDQCIDQYFQFNQRMIGIGRTYSHSFLSECTLYDKMQIRNMLIDNGYKSIMDFINKAADVIDDSCFPAESELYGSYIYATQPDLYVYRKLKAVLGGKYGSKPWTDSEIIDRINEIAPQEADIFTIHTWEGATE